MSRERIGIMGGTFNPIHLGHVAMAQACIRAASLDRVLFLPAGQPPHKSGIASAEDRWRMVCAAVAPYKRLEPCRMELDREGTTYTFDTLTSLREQYPKAAFFYIIGADTLLQLHSWHRYQEVLHLCSFLVCPRAGVSEDAIARERARLQAEGARFVFVKMDSVDISSTEVREALAAGEPVELLNPAVCEYAGVMGLYGCPARVYRSVITGSASVSGFMYLAWRKNVFPLGVVAGMRSYPLNMTRLKVSYVTISSSSSPSSVTS